MGNKPDLREQQVSAFRSFNTPAEMAGKYRQRYHHESK